MDTMRKEAVLATEYATGVKLKYMKPIKTNLIGNCRVSGLSAHTFLFSRGHQTCCRGLNGLRTSSGFKDSHNRSWMFGDNGRPYPLPTLWILTGKLDLPASLFVYLDLYCAGMHLKSFSTIDAPADIRCDIQEEEAWGKLGYHVFGGTRTMGTY